MKEQKITIKDPIGIHARPAAQLIQAIKDFDCEIKVLKGDKSANLKSLLSLMGLSVKQGDEITLVAEGKDEEIALEKAIEFIEKNL